MVSTKRKSTRVLISILVVMLIAVTMFMAACSGSKKDVAYIEIKCDQLSSDMSLLKNDAVKEYIPEDGVILEKTAIEIKEGDTAFDVFETACKDNDIQYESSETEWGPYIMGIGHLYPQDVGPNAGWMFNINGKSAAEGAGSYKVQTDDVLTFYYTVDYTKESMDTGDDAADDASDDEGEAKKAA